MTPRSERLTAGLRWFAAEFLVVVTGVLVALAMNAWWTDRADRQAERASLQYLVADLRAAERSVATTDSLQLPSDVAGVALQRAYYMPVPPPADSIVRWLYRIDRYGTPTIPTGTAEALVATGGLNLIRDDSLRAHVTSYLQSVRAREADQLHSVEFFGRASDIVEARVDFGDILASTMSPERIDSLGRRLPMFPLPPGPRRRPFPVDTRAVLADRALFAGISNINVAHSNLRSTRNQMARDARTLREHIERVMGGPR